MTNERHDPVPGAPATPPSPGDPNHDALILSVLREVLARQAAAPVADSPSTPITPSEPLDEAQTERAPSPSSSTARPGRVWVDPDSGLTRTELDVIADYEARAAAPDEGQPEVARSLRRLLLGVLLAAAVVNVPLVQGRPLSQALPDREALVIRDGLVLKGPGPEIYELEDGRKRWLSTMDVFEQRGHTWDDVHLVDADYLGLFEDGRPFFALVKCSDSPHVYRLEDGERRWIQDIETFQAEGHVWEEITYRSCADLAAIPLGPPVPPDAGYPERDASTGPLPGGGRR